MYVIQSETEDDEDEWHSIDTYEMKDSRTRWIEHTTTQKRN